MSLFGASLPFEDDTATSLIRRSGFPPESTYAQMPEIYLCPCCSEFSKQQERERLLREAREAKEAERRRILQLDVFEERARPLPSGDIRRKGYRRILDGEEVAEAAQNVPPPPTLDELRRAKRDQNVPKLVVTIHCGRNLNAGPDDLVSVIVRCGAFEGQTEKMPRGKEITTPWEELFEFPYMNANEPLEVLVVNSALGLEEDQLMGGVAVPPSALQDRRCGDQEPLPVMLEDGMRSGYGSCKEGPMGAIVASWYVRDGEEKLDEEAIEKQTLSMPLNCTIVARHLFQYTDYGATLYTGGVLCVLRDTSDNCSESVLYTPGSHAEASLSPYYTKEGFYYHPENASQLMQLNTEKKLGHILVCVPKEDETEGDEEELLVIGAVPLEFARLCKKGRAVLLIESKSKEDALWGEIAIEWCNKPLDEEELHPAALEVKRESLFVTVVRGLNLSDRNGDPLKGGSISVATGDLEGVTVEAPVALDEDGNHVITWNQEVRFMDVEKNQKDIEVQVYEKGCLMSVGTCELEANDDGVVIMQLYKAANASQESGEVVLSYKRLHATSSKEALMQRKRGGVKGALSRGADEEDEEEGDVEQRGDKGAEVTGDGYEEEGEEESDVEQRGDQGAEVTGDGYEEEGEEEGGMEQRGDQGAEVTGDGYEEVEEMRTGASALQSEGAMSINDEASEALGAEEAAQQQQSEEGSQQRQLRDEAQSEEGMRMGELQEEYLEKEEGAEREGVRFHEYDPDEEAPKSESARERASSALYPDAAGASRPRRISWEAPAGKDVEYRQPWYPAGAPDTDQHIPFTKTKLSKKNIESIRQLETCKLRIEEESVRRSLTPRHSPSRGVSPSSQ
ncbi:hypothetical protein LSCM1_04942 [Leishmania martiniquensis]|uniref:C2 domain-containing protein n=1 Tax=Leishmania martiniquensis TaxID=1580590 RepID=A0A836KQ09_9TRYP|nr:hypothetical protein LSCM1_04942 [Leishmania martiniquensis]